MSENTMIEKARDLGREIQADERYIKMMTAKQAWEADEYLQNAIGEFNLKRMAINAEAQNEERNEDKLRQLNEELKEIYATITSNENLKVFNEVKQEVDEMVQRITGIITLCGDGFDPETADYTPPSCGGDCSGCAGCS